METKTSELVSGLTLMLIGVSYGSMTLKGLDIGSPSQMGPGFFPIILSSLVVGVGGIILLKGGFSRAPLGALPSVPFKPILLVASSILLIIFFIDTLGMALTIFLSSIVSSRAARNISLKSSVVTAATIAALCTVVFSYLMQVPIPPWPHGRL